MIITEILSRNARVYGKETALIERDPARLNRREITWEEFDRQANAVANALIRRGVRKGDKVVHLMTNCIEWLPVYFGILRTGAWAVPLNFRFLSPAIARCTRISEARAIIFGEEFIERLAEAREQLDATVSAYIFVGDEEKQPAWAEAYDEVVKTASEDEPGVAISLCDSAALYFTSGTTGKPKAVHITHRNLEFACYVENRHHNQTHGDNFLCIPPLYHAGAKMHWFGSFIVGAKSVILKGTRPRWILEAVSEEKVTVVWLLVPWAHDILIALENGDLTLNNYKLDQWRFMHIGAQPVPPSLIRKWKQTFPHHDYDTNYGLTEATGPGCVHLGIDNIQKVGAIGVPGFDWECRIVNSDMKPVPPGGSGELLVKGPGVMKEYYKNPEATAETLKDGWLCTGDIARVDGEGFLWLVDRKKDVIITGGENIFPVEVEDFLMNHDSIQDVGVIGVPDERLGELVAAVIRVKPNHQLSEEEVREFCEGLARYKRPRRIFFDDVPRNPTGKIEKPRLRKRYRDLG
ncbi:AMP-dependent synthetase [Desulfonema ishimotonii]|uniref:AMP-dependent synthetase n=1 Tax=Desulfonema ishimotonii TaxID=45657 RepID=A0A401FW44_9BACT|nr:AMP-binding protein [Desulfonema ishimotonii]GBC61188.1 AMP-dependent synthetase [Desulfonema ishimotonii]